MKSKILRLVFLAILILTVGFVVRTAAPLISDLGTPGPTDQTVLEDFEPQNQATFHGGWRTVEMDEALGPQSVLINCRHKEMECVLVQTNISYADYFYQNIAYYQVTNWTDEGVITAEQKGECGNIIITADARSASAKMVTMWDQTKTEECELTSGKISTEWVLDWVEPSVFAKIREYVNNSWYDFTN